MSYPTNSKLNRKRDEEEEADADDDDDLLCEYDSTWEETESELNGERSWRNTLYKWRGRNVRAAYDMQTYRRGYPNKDKSANWSAHSNVDQEDEPMVNLRFYRNEIPSAPDNLYIDDFHGWKGEYDRLEWVHSYIQWLFPLQESGMNYCAKVLTKKEIEEFCKDQEAKQRLLTSYEMMLDFYGIQLVDKSSGAVERSANWEERFDNLNRNSHNNLRITRILKSLGELGFKHYQAPLVKFFLKETLINDNLYHVKHSVMDYFLFAVRDKEERKELIKFAFRHYKRKDEFVWCPRKIQRELLKNLDVQEPDEGGPLDESGCEQENESNLRKDTPETSKAFQSQPLSVHPRPDLDAQDPEKSGPLDESGFDQDNKTNLPEDSPATLNAVQCQASKVDPLLESSVEQPPPATRETDQPSSLDSGILNADCSCGPGVECSSFTTNSLSPQEFVMNEPAQEEGSEAKSREVPGKTQTNRQDIKNNTTIDDTPAAEQESALEKQNTTERVGIARNPCGNCLEEKHDPAGKKGGRSDSCNPVQDGGVTGIIDHQLPKSSESSTAVGGADIESKALLCKRAGSHEPAGAAENDNRPKGGIQSPQPQAKGMESSKTEGVAVESSGPKGGLEFMSPILERVMELSRLEDAATITETPKPDIGADKDERPDDPVEDTPSGNDAGEVLPTPDAGKTSDDAMMLEDLHQTPGGDNKADEEPMEID